MTERDDDVETTPADGNIFADLGLPRPDDRLAIYETIRAMHGRRSVPDGWAWCIDPDCSMQYTNGCHLHPREAPSP